MVKRVSKDRTTLNESKVPLDLTIDTALLMVAFVVLMLIATVSPSLFERSYMMAIEIALSIPFLASSAFVRVKMMGMPESAVLDRFSYVTFIIGYALIINTIGIMLSITVSSFVSILFLAMNVAIALAYSTALVTDHMEMAKQRFGRDLLFTIIIVVLGILMVIR
ncbi:MAG: hypothetical protein NT120_05295 [Candidatus Aenigmarchaeota archaeon]|nr:hypothetical protein [Candidatus Aenigmarchaeota archaeon]